MKTSVEPDCIARQLRQCACPVLRFPGGWWILHRCGVALPGMRLATAEERAAMDNLWTKENK